MSMCIHWICIAFAIRLDCLFIFDCRVVINTADARSGKWEALVECVLPVLAIRNWCFMFTYRILSAMQSRPMQTISYVDSFYFFYESLIWNKINEISIKIQWHIGLMFLKIVERKLSAKIRYYIRCDCSSPFIIHQNWWKTKKFFVVIFDICNKLFYQNGICNGMASILYFEAVQSNNISI